MAENMKVLGLKENLLGQDIRYILMELVLKEYGKMVFSHQMKID